MRLAEFLQTGKAYLAERGDLSKDIFVALIVVLVGLGSFALGRISALETAREGELRVIAENAEVSTLESVAEISSASTSQHAVGAPSLPKVEGKYVGARSGKAYYLPWCGGVKQIREENKVWFATKEEAEARGYHPAANCKGM